LFSHSGHFLDDCTLALLNSTEKVPKQSAGNVFIVINQEDNLHSLPLVSQFEL